MYKLKPGEFVKDGKLHGWTGQICGRCGGMGEGEVGQEHCRGCGGTGEAHGVMPTQPADLPPDTE